MDTLQQALTKLGPDLPGVLNELRRTGITGQRGNSCECPIAHYLHKATGDHGLHVGAEIVFYSSAGLAFDKVVDLKYAQRSFIDAFDRGSYPDLQETEETP